MKNLSLYAVNPFVIALQQASRENVIHFTGDTEDRFIANNKNGAYTTLIERLANQRIAYEESFSKQQLGLQKGATRSVEEAIEAIKQTGRRLHAKCIDAFGINSIEAMAFFPKKLNGLHRANRGHYKAVLQGWDEQATLHADKMGDAWVQEIKSLRNDWLKWLASQSTQKTEVKNGSTDGKLITLPLATTLYAMYIEVLKNNVESGKTEEIIGSYFNEAPLQQQRYNKTDSRGRCFGVVTNADGQLVPNVAIVITDAGQQVRWKGGTKGTGKWRCVLLPIGQYTISFSKPGLETQTIAHEILDHVDTQVDVVMG